MEGQVLGLFDGVTVHIRAGGVEIETEPDCCPLSFQQAIELIGATGRTDYQISYDPRTGVETYRFEV